MLGKSIGTFTLHKIKHAQGAYYTAKSAFGGSKQNRNGIKAIVTWEGTNLLH